MGELHTKVMVIGLSRYTTRVFCPQQKGFPSNSAQARAWHCFTFNNEGTWQVCKGPQSRLQCPNKQTGNASTTDGEKGKLPSKRPPFVPLSSPQMHEITTPITTNHIQSLLTGYDEHKVHVWVNGFIEGFRILLRTRRTIDSINNYNRQWLGWIYLWQNWGT